MSEYFPKELEPAVTMMPLAFYVPPNGAGADYIAETNFLGFVAYGFRACWLGSGPDDPNEDCNLPRPVTRHDVKHLRTSFLSFLERTIAMLWAGEVEKDGKTIDFGNNGESVEFTEDGEDLVQAGWVVTPQNDALMMELDLTGCDASVVWMSYAAIKDRHNVVKVLREAHRHTYEKEIHPNLLELVYRSPDEPTQSRTERLLTYAGMLDEIFQPDSCAYVRNVGGFVVVIDENKMRTYLEALRHHRELSTAFVGDVWQEDHTYTRQDWADDVSGGNTLRGYWDWVAHNRETADEQPDDE